MSQTSTALQNDLLRRIVDLIHEGDLEPGSRLKESQLAERLSVSRTPVRAVLERLAADGFAERRPNRGMILTLRPPRIDGDAAPREDLLIGIARLRREGLLADQFAESELMRLTGSERTEVREALVKLEELGMLRRRSGYGWQFASALRDEHARRESYRFRLVIECAAILEPGFTLDPGWSAEMRARHASVIEAPWTAKASIALFEMNSEFHEGICAASGNRYFKEAMQRQNQLRRLSNYDWRYGPERVQRTCREHVEILDRLATGHNHVAAALMREHLEAASTVRSTAG